MNKSYHGQRTFCPRRLEFYLWLQITTLGFFYMLQSSSPLFPLPFYGSFSTLYRLSLIIWTLHLLITWTPTWAPIPLDTPFSPLWVAAAKAALFRGLLHINAARKAARVYLMWWWQLFLRYFEFSFLSRVQGAYFKCLSIHLVWVCRVRGGLRRSSSSDLLPFVSH